MVRLNPILIGMLFIPSVISLGCAEEVGTAQIFVEPEDSIPDGLEPGTGEENIQDGWAVRYDRFLIAIGNVRASQTSGEGSLSDASAYALDLRNAPAGGYVIATFEDAAAVRWDRFGFDLPNAKEGTLALPPTESADAAMLAQNGYSLYIEGAISKADGESCPPGGTCKPAPEVKFAWGLSAGTSFDDCATEDGFAGFAVPAGGAAQVKPTIHGDHWFFSGVTAGAEVTERLAQYIADSDIDQNGETTLDELKQVKAEDVFPSPPYNLSGALGGPVATAYDYVLAQARTLGDFQGDGECPTRRILP
jgi:hypothetical protein